MNRKYLPPLLLCALVLAIPLTVFLSQHVQNLTQQAAEENTKAISPGQLLLTATFNSIGIELPYQFDDNKNAIASVSFREKGQANWRTGLPLWQVVKDKKTFLSPNEDLNSNWDIGDATSSARWDAVNEDQDKAGTAKELGYIFSTTAGNVQTFGFESIPSNDTNAKFPYHVEARVGVNAKIMDGDDDIRMEILLNGSIIKTQVINLTKTFDYYTIPVTPPNRWSSADLDNLQVRMTHVQVGTNVDEIRLRQIDTRILSLSEERAFYGSVMLLDPGIEYEIKVTMSDSDGVTRQPEIIDTMTTRANNIPTASTLTPTHFVSADGVDNNNGSLNSPWKTLEKAFISAPSGAIVQIGSGSFAPPITVRQSPITLVAQFPAVNDQRETTNDTKRTVIESGLFAPPNTNTWRLVTLKGPHTGKDFTVWKWATPYVEPGILAIASNRTEVPKRVARWSQKNPTLNTGETIGNYNLKTPEGWAEVMYENWNQYSYGYNTFGNTNDPKDIYVRLPQDKNPNDYYTFLGGPNTFSVNSTARLSGLEIRLSRVTFMANAHNGIVDHNLFYVSGIDYDAKNSPADEPDIYPTNHVVQYNRMIDTGLGDSPEWPGVPWNFIKNSVKLSDVSGTFERTGESMETSGTAIHGIGAANQLMVRYNTIEGYFNGIGGQSQGFDKNTKRDYDIYNNFFNAITDDAFEPDLGAINWRIWNNRIQRTPVILSAGPLKYGPLYMFRNIMWDVGSNGLAVNKNGEQGGGHFVIKYSGSSLPMARIFLINNTIWTNQDRYNGTLQAAGGDSNPESFYVRNNIVRVTRYVFSTPGSSRWDEDYNFMATTDITRGVNFVSKEYKNLAEYREVSGRGINSNKINGTDYDFSKPETLALVDSGLVDTTTGDLRLTTNSPFIDSGTIIPNIADSYLGAAPDLGAVEAGSGNQITPTPTQSGNQTATPTRTPTPTITPTRSPSATPTQPIDPTNTPLPPTNTPIPGTTTLLFTVKLHGLGTGGDSVNPSATGNLNPLIKDRPLRVEVYRALDNKLLTTITGLVFYDKTTGTYKGSLTAPSIITTNGYNLRIKSQRYLWNQLLGVQLSSGQSNIIDTITLTTGDINNDTVIDILDYNAMVSCYGTVGPTKPDTCQSTFDKDSDLFDDGNVNFIDLNLWLREFSKKT